MSFGRFVGELGIVNRPRRPEVTLGQRRHSGLDLASGQVFERNPDVAKDCAHLWPIVARGVECQATRGYQVGHAVGIGHAQVAGEVLPTMGCFPRREHGVEGGVIESDDRRRRTRGPRSYCWASVDAHNPAAAAREFERDRCSHHAGANHDGVITVARRGLRHQRNLDRFSVRDHDGRLTAPSASPCPGMFCLVMLRAKLRFKTD